MSESNLSELLRQIRQAGADACIFVEGMGQEISSTISERIKL